MIIINLRQPEAAEKRRKKAPLIWGLSSFLCRFCILCCAPKTSACCRRSEGNVVGHNQVFHQAVSFVRSPFAASGLHSNRQSVFRKLSASLGTRPFTPSFAASSAVWRIFPRLLNSQTESRFWIIPQGNTPWFHSQEWLTGKHTRYPNSLLITHRKDATRNLG